MELTIGSFLKQHPEHEIDIHVGVHLNFCHYTHDYRMFEDLRGIAQIHMVPEIDWAQHGDSMYRYSTMHAKSLENLIHHAAYYQFDRLVILDHDLHIKGPFVSECLKRYPDADIVGAAFEDASELREFLTGYGQMLYALPKISIWHVVLTRRAFDKIMEDPRVVYPRILEGDDRVQYGSPYKADKDFPIFVDTFADVFHRCRYHWGLSHGLVESAQFDQWVKHYSGSSFNYGSRLLGIERYTGRMQESLDLFQKEFPEGLAPFRAKRSK